jgi:hypothetical protein
MFTQHCIVVVSTYATTRPFTWAPIGVSSATGTPPVSLGGITMLVQTPAAPGKTKHPVIQFCTT